MSLSVIVIVEFKLYLSTYCLMKGRYFLCSKFYNFKKKNYLKIRIKTFNGIYIHDLKTIYTFAQCHVNN